MGKVVLGFIEVVDVQDGEVVGGWGEYAREVAGDGGFARRGKAAKGDNQRGRGHGRSPHNSLHGVIGGITGSQVQGERIEYQCISYVPDFESASAQD